ncbi:hypothetical protein [Nucisporomicrobium flavum]|uniref:hypothetical protein n=1 Tax=Nucisporomicrobium flavum TaxID=2785915 RepID=UPI0018F399A1|nr:hypothetical protein [Nucisporomicrobium flavum]
MSDLFDQERATVREWTDVLARVRFGTVKVAGRNVAGARIKAVAARLADYADSDGSRVRPGIARIAVDLESDYSSVKRAVQYLVRVGLLSLVRAGTAAGRADEYQLSIPASLTDELEVWSPARHHLETDRVRQANRGRYKKANPTADPENLRLPHAPADDETNSGPRVHQASADPADSVASAGASGTDFPAPAGASGTDLRVHQAPATEQDLDTTTTEPTDGDVCTAITGPRARETSDEPDTPRLADRCQHGLTSRRRPDGTPSCALCRRGITANSPLAPVIPLRPAAS